MPELRLFHGGVPGLRPGDLVEPGHDRRVHAGCPFCEAREAQKAGAPGPELDPIGVPIRSTEDTIESWHAPALRVTAVLDRAVLMTWGQRRALSREWTAADHAHDRKDT
jgi:hypothetical protein